MFKALTEAVPLLNQNETRIKGYFTAAGKNSEILRHLK